jgi:hypothetical protein
MADKTKTIKGATDKELDELLVRLRKENELQYLIADIKRRSSPDGFTSYDNQQVSTEVPIDSLYHVGVLGMHWGRRKGSSSTSSSSGSHGTSSEDHDKVHVTLKGKKLKEMSNAELKTFNERLQLERTFKDLTKTEVSAGRKFVNDILVSTGSDLAKTYSKKYATKLVENLIKKAAKAKG